MKQIELGKGYFALVDDEDFASVAEHKWYAFVARRYKGRVWIYAATSIEGKNVLMHRHILQAKRGEHVDHINGNRLDNCRCNLRKCTHAENMRNRKRHANTASGFKGVYPSRDRWFSTIMVDGVAHNLGYFDTAEEAAKTYDKAARNLHGEFAYVNFPAS